MRSPPVYNRDLPLLQEMNANAIRLYGWMNAVSHQAFLDAAYQRGILVVVAYRWNWNLYSSGGESRIRRKLMEAATGQQQMRDEVVTMVQNCATHPAGTNSIFPILTYVVFMWSIGNELNLGRGYQTDVWDFIASLKSK